MSTLAAPRVSVKRPRQHGLLEILEKSSMAVTKAIAKPELVSLRAEIEQLKAGLATLPPVKARARLAVLREWLHALIEDLEAKL